MDLRLQVKQYIRQEHLLREGDHVIVGLSGGADSVCLLHCLKSLQEELGITLSAVHVHHGIRGEEADRDANFCSLLCRREKIPFRLLHCNVPEEARSRKRSEEETARDLRYLLLREAMRDYRSFHPETRVRLAVAHHMDDQAETVVMNLCRGTGIRGLGGMAPERDGIVRPLLGCRRADIEEWLKIHDYEWIEDGTNRSDDYTRNRIRHQLLPELLQVNRRSVEHLAFIALQAQEWDDYIEAECERVLKEVPDWSVLPVSQLAALPRVLQGRILHRCIAHAAGGARNISRRHIEAVRGLLAAQVGAEIRLPGGIRAVRGYSDVTMTREELPPRAAEQIPVRADFSVFPRRKNQKIPEKQYTKWFDYDKMTGTVAFRTRRTGDVIALAGVGKKPVNRYMIDEKIPAEDRDILPVLAEGEQVLWIVGYRMSAAYQVTEETRTILQVTVHPTEELRRITERVSPQ